MKCFYDPTQDAIGTCKSCGKGLSADYSVDLGKGLACKGRCEEDVRRLIELIEHNISMRGASANIMRGAGRGGMLTSVVHFVLGCAFLGFGIRHREEIDAFPIMVGIVFLIWGIVTFRRSLAYQRTIPGAPKRDA